MIVRAPHLSTVLQAAARLCCAGFIALSAGVAMAETAPAPPLAAEEAPVPAFGPIGIEAGINDAVRDFMQSPRFAGVPEAEVRDRVEFVAGNVIFATLHEVGHMLISQMALPVLGREEDAADAFATLIFLRVGSVFSDRLLNQAARGWFLSERRDLKRRAALDFSDEHALDRQRAYNIVCLMVGSNLEKFGELADMARMPPARQHTCQFDYSNASWSWDKALAPHRRKPEQPKTDIAVSYADSPDHEIYVTGFRDIRLLETLANILSDRFVFPNPIGLAMGSCGVVNARWNFLARKIHVCYELAADFADVYREYAGGAVRVSSFEVETLDLGILAAFRAAPE